MTPILESELELVDINVVELVCDKSELELVDMNIMENVSGTADWNKK